STRVFIVARLVCCACLLSFLSSSGPPLALPSFPTRRSSDLIWGPFVEHLGHPVRHWPVDNVRMPGHPADVGWVTGNSYIVYGPIDRKSTRLNSSHVSISYAVFCLKKKTNDLHINPTTRNKPA